MTMHTESEMRYAYERGRVDGFKRGLVAASMLWVVASMFYLAAQM